MWVRKVKKKAFFQWKVYIVNTYYALTTAIFRNIVFYSFYKTYSTNKFCDVLIKHLMQWLFPWAYFQYMFQISLFWVFRYNCYNLNYINKTMWVTHSLECRCIRHDTSCYIHWCLTKSSHTPSASLIIVLQEYPCNKYIYQLLFWEPPRCPTYPLEPKSQSSQRFFRTYSRDNCLVFGKLMEKVI